MGGDGIGGPLHGVNVIDLGTAYVGPWAASLLGLLGAEVIKIESPSGDRHHLQKPNQRGVATTYTAVNLNKRAAILDLKDPSIRPAIDHLISQADVIMQNLRPGVVDRMGFGHQRASAINPQIVSASSPAWGVTGPMTNLPALDSQVQVFSGFASLNGPEVGRPEMMRYPQLDINGATFFASTVLLGLLARQRTGGGLEVSATHVGSAVMLQTNRLAEFFATGQRPVPLGDAAVETAPNRYVRCRDLVYLAVSVENQAQWHGFCQAIQRDDLRNDPRFSTNRDRVLHRADLDAILDAEFARQPARWWAIGLERERVPFAYLHDFEDLRFHQHIIENGFLGHIHPQHQGLMAAAGVPWQFSGTPVAIDVDVPAPGRDTDSILASGFTAAGQGAPAGAADPSAPPLTGIRVVDATQGSVGPLTGLFLAEAGAEVIKIEPPGGDYARDFAPALPDGDSALFAALNRNKQSVVLDLDSEAGQVAFRELAKTADIVLEDWGPDVAAGRSLDDAALRGSNPALIVCALTAFGERGPLRSQPGSELVMQAWSGYWQNLGELGGRPLRVGTDIVGVGTAVLAFVGILAALYHRQNGGSGQRVAVSQLGVALSLRTAQWAAETDPDRWESDTFSNNHVSGPRYGYRTADGDIYCNLNNGSEDQFLTILADLGMLDEVIDDPRFGEGGRHAIGVGKHAREVLPIWERYFARRPASEVMAILNRNAGGAVELLHLDELLNHPQVRPLDLVAEDERGRRYNRPPWRGPWNPPAVRSAPTSELEMATV